MAKWVLDTIEGRTEFDKLEDAKAALIERMEGAMDNVTDISMMADLNDAMTEVEEMSEPRGFCCNPSRSLT